MRTFVCTCLMLLASIQAKKQKDLEIIVEHKPDPCTDVANSGDEIKVHYTGSLENGVVFDSSRRDGRIPLHFVLGQKKVIAGWEKGIVGMCVGEKRKLIIPPHLAYGKNGAPPHIPGDATLIFETELIAIKRESGGASLFSLLRLLAIPAAVGFILKYFYDKYQESEQNKPSKKQLKEERRNKKKKH